MASLELAITCPEESRTTWMSTCAERQGMGTCNHVTTGWSKWPLPWHFGVTNNTRYGKDMQTARLHGEVGKDTPRSGFPPKWHTPPFLARDCRPLKKTATPEVNQNWLCPELPSQTGCSVNACIADCVSPQVQPQSADKSHMETHEPQSPEAGFGQDSKILDTEAPKKFSSLW